MKKLIMVLAATLICGACLFTSCKKEDNSLKLEEKIIGKWMMTDRDGQPIATDGKLVYTFVSPNKALVSASLNYRPVVGTRWSDQVEADIAISGNKVTVNINLDEQTTVAEEFTVTAISGSEFTANHKVTVTVDGNVMLSDEDILRFVKTTADYSATILGTWQGHCTSEGSVFDDGQEHRWEYRADGTYVYYRLDGTAWVPYGDDFAEYFVDGNLLCTRWRNSGEETENREWWEITIDGTQMHWTALREDANGQRFTATFEMEKVN